MSAILVGAVESSRIALEVMARVPQCDLKAVVTLAPHLAHRHSDAVDMAAAARALDVPVIAVENVNARDALVRIAEVQADHIFVIGWSQICGPEFRALAPGGVIGYHPAALPRLRGRGVIPWTIVNREPITAGSLFWIDDGVDTGPILDQHYFHLSPREDAASLYRKHVRALEIMLHRSLPLIAAGTAPRIPQDESCATFCARRTDADGEIDWAAPSSDVLRLIRAATRPYPGAFTANGTGRIRIWAAEPTRGGDGGHLAAPGQIVARGNNGFTVRCGDGGLVEVTEWSNESGKMPALHSRLHGEPCGTTQ
jgi:Methionyl-tRNA formyltransferase